MSEPQTQNNHPPEPEIKTRNLNLDNLLPKMPQEDNWKIKDKNGILQIGQWRRKMFHHLQRRNLLFFGRYVQWI